jgi:hypothetical protein
MMTAFSWTMRAIFRFVKSMHTQYISIREYQLKLFITCLEQASRIGVAMIVLLI